MRRTNQTRTLALVPIVPLALMFGASVAFGAEDPDDWELSNAGFGGMWGRNMMTPGSPLTRTDLDRFRSALELDETQELLLDDLYADLIARHRHEWTLFAEQAADMRHEAQTDQNWQEMQAKTKELGDGLAETQEELIERFMADLRLVLTPAQEQRWERVERDHERARTIGEYASFDEEAFDLVSVVASLDVDDDVRAGLEPTLDRYADTIDPLLQTRNRKAEALGEMHAAVQSDQMAMWGGAQEEMGPEEMQELMAALEERKHEVVADALETREACERVRDVNIRYRDEIARALSGVALEDFQRMTDVELEDERMFFANFSRAKGMIGKLRKLDSTVDMMSTWMEAGGSDVGSEYVALARAVAPLSRDQLDRLDAIEERLDSELDALQRLHAEKTGRSAPGEEDLIRVGTPDGAVTLTRRGSEADAWSFRQQQDPELAREKAEITQRAVDDIRAILTMNQRAIIAFQ